MSAPHSTPGSASASAAAPAPLLLTCPWDPSQRTDVTAAVRRIVDAYRLATKTAVPRVRLDPFAERLAAAAAECVDAFPEIDRLLQAAQAYADDPTALLMRDPKDRNFVADAFAAVGWDGPFWPQSERVLVPLDEPIAAGVDEEALERAAEMMLTTWADYVHEWRAGHVTQESASEP